MTDLSAPQHRHLTRDRQALHLAALTASSLAAILGDAHLGAALVTTPDTPPSKWSTGAIPAKGSVSDPTGSAAVRDIPVDDRLARLSRGITELVGSVAHLHQLATQLAANLEPDKGQSGWQGDADLDAENMGAGRCDVCDDPVTGTRTDRLVALGRRLDNGKDMRGCGACYRAWRRTQDRDLDADFWQWANDRRHHIERTDGREAV
jgi:hypothetical protein